METPAQYERRYNLRLVDRLGDGKDGRVFETNRRNAVKFLIDDSLYHREFRAYQILQDRDIDQFHGFQIPRLIRHDDELRAIEMTIVDAPFVLDFASAYTIEENNRFDFPEDVVSEREAHWAEIFGERWPIVQAVCNAFTEATGLILLDLSLNNIKF